MKILLICNEFSNDGAVASHRNIGFAKSLIEKNHEVTVLCCAELSSNTLELNAEIIKVSNTFIKLLQRNLSNSTSVKGDSKKTSPIEWFLRFRKKTGILFLGRLPDVSFFWKLTAWKKIKNHQPWDIVIGSFAPYACLDLALKIKQKNLAKTFIADFRDPWTQHHLFSGLPLINTYEKYKEKTVISKADLITTATKGVKKKLVKQPKVHLNIYNGFDTYSQKRKPTKKFNIVHTGSLYTHKQNLQTFFGALKKAQNIYPLITVSFLGNEKAYIDKLIKENGLDCNKVKHYGLVDSKKSEEYIIDSSCTLSFDLNDRNFNGIVPTKLSSYIAHKKPIFQILKTRDSEASRFLKNYPVCYTSHYNEESIYLTLIEIYEENVRDNKLLKSFDNEQFSRAKQTEPLLEYIEKLSK